jgi:hypothetical protein
MASDEELRSDVIQLKESLDKTLQREQDFLASQGKTLDVKSWFLGLPTDVRYAGGPPYHVSFLALRRARLFMCSGTKDTTRPTSATAHAAIERRAYAVGPDCFDNRRRLGVDRRWNGCDVWCRTPARYVERLGSDVLRPVVLLPTRQPPAHILVAPLCFAAHRISMPGLRGHRFGVVLALPILVLGWSAGIRRAFLRHQGYLPNGQPSRFPDYVSDRVPHFIKHKTHDKRQTLPATLKTAPTTML